MLYGRCEIKTYQHTTYFAADLSADEQINRFEVLNNAGSRVSIIPMRFLKLKAYGMDNNRLNKYNRSDYVNYLIGSPVFHREGITDKQKQP